MEDDAFSMDVDGIIEVREEYMLSPSSTPIRRIAYFLKPCQNSILEPPPPPHDSLHSNHMKAIPQVRYNGWLKPQQDWKKWVQKMQIKYEFLWIKAGIDKAIQASTYEFYRNNDLILALAQRWCSKTNTFVFPWGEATITLEDMKVCWGYSVTGAPVSSAVETGEQKEMEAELIAARRMFNSTKSKKVTHRPWMMHFMTNESRVEHEAFLIYWLSRFVFGKGRKAYDAILKNVFPIAIHLARGTRVALAPAVLASIYMDLSLLNNAINNNDTMVNLWAPFQVVQIWAMERFPALQPYPQAAEQAQPQLAKWDEVKMVRNKNLKSMLDSAGASNRFLWRPYNNSPSLKVYNDKDKWECDHPSLDDELESFGRCLRVCKLVGMGCVEQYQPNRVALQFGLDQDIPCMVLDCDNDPWMCYSRPIVDMNLKIALFCCQSNATSRYYDWWKQSKLENDGDTMECYDVCPISISSPKHMSPISNGKVECEGSFGPPPGFTSKFGRDQAEDFDKKNELPIHELLSSSHKEAKGFDDEVVGNDKALSGSQSGAFQSSAGVETAGSKRIMEEVQTEIVAGVNDMEVEGVSAYRAAILASNIEKRIPELERMVAELKAKFSSKQAKP